MADESEIVGKLMAQKEFLKTEIDTIDKHVIYLKSSIKRSTERLGIFERTKLFYKTQTSLINLDEYKNALLQIEKLSFKIEENELQLLRSEAKLKKEQETLNIINSKLRSLEKMEEKGKVVQFRRKNG